MGREHTILSKLWRAYPRAPRAWALCEDEAVIGARFVVQEYRGDGVVVFGEAPSDMAGLPNLGGRLATAMADALHELHSVDYIAVGLSDLGKPEGFVARQLSGWLDRWRRVAASDCADVMDRVAERLAREAPTVSCNAIVHNDYKLDNCQFAVGVPDEVISVFDWDMATLGDPLIDVGITLAYWSHMQRGESLGLPSRETFAALYAERAGIDAGELSWYEAFAHWRNAVAVQQLYERYVRGESQNPKLAGAGKAVATMANRAEAILENRTS